MVLWWKAAWWRWRTRSSSLAYWDALNCRGRDMLHQTLPTHSFIAQLPTSIARGHACLTVLGSGRHLLTVSWVDRTPDEASVWWRNDWLIVCLKWISVAKQSVAHIYWMSSSLRSIVNILESTSGRTTVLPSSWSWTFFCYLLVVSWYRIENQFHDRSSSEYYKNVTRNKNN